MTTTMRTSAAAPSHAAGSANWKVSRQEWDSHGSLDWVSGKTTLVRSEGQGPVADPAVNAAHDNAETVFNFYRDVLGRNGIDGKGSPIVSVVHGVFPLDVFGMRTTPNNAAWVQQLGRMVYGDGDGKMFGPLVNGLDVVGHELTHGVTGSTAKLVYAGQSGALNESWSDVMGELVQQWSKNKAAFADPKYAQTSEWLVGEDVLTPGKPGDALRDFAHPEKGYSPQPGNMSEYKDLPIDRKNDNGGVHINSGIPNRAAYLAAVKIGDEKLAKVWYDALTTKLKSTSNFSDAAKATIESAQQLYSNDASVSQAVKDAWAAVGVDPNHPTHVQPIPASVLNEDQAGDPDGGFVPASMNGIAAQGAANYMHFG